MNDALLADVILSNATLKQLGAAHRVLEGSPYLQAFAGLRGGLNASILTAGLPMKSPLADLKLETLAPSSALMKAMAATRWDSTPLLASVMKSAQVLPRLDTVNLLTTSAHRRLFESFSGRRVGFAAAASLPSLVTRWPHTQTLAATMARDLMGDLSTVRQAQLIAAGPLSRMFNQVDALGLQTSAEEVVGESLRMEGPPLADDGLLSDDPVTVQGWLSGLIVIALQKVGMEDADLTKEPVRATVALLAGLMATALVYGHYDLISKVVYSLGTGVMATGLVWRVAHPRQQDNKLRSAQRAQGPRGQEEEALHHDVERRP